MINFDYFEKNKGKLRNQHMTSKPFPHLVIVNLCEEENIEPLHRNIPKLHNKSIDYLFAGNKFERSYYFELGPLFKELYEDLRNTRMNSFLSY